jgi:cytochrome c oxidase subunit IV
MDTPHGASRIHDAHGEQTGHTEPTPHHHVPYYLIFGVLVVLTGITVAVAFIEIKSEIVKVLLALAIASIKASAVAFFFMHLKFEGKLIYLILIVPLLLCILLVCALIPDIVYGAPFDRMTHLPGPQTPH